jgi:hypothetical protein
VRKDLADHVWEECRIEPKATDHTAVVDGDEVDGVVVVEGVDVAIVGTREFVPPALVHEDVVPQPVMLIENPRVP